MRLFHANTFNLENTLNYGLLPTSQLGGFTVQSYVRCSKDYRQHVRTAIGSGADGAPYRCKWLAAVRRLEAPA